MKAITLAGLALIASLALSCQRSTEPKNIASVEEQRKMESNKNAPKLDQAAKPEEEANKDLAEFKSEAPPDLLSNDPVPPPVPPGKSGRPQSPSAPIPTDWEKKIVRNADISMQVNNIRAASQQIKTATQLNGAFVASSNEQQLSNQIRIDMTIKVPRERFDELVEKIQGSGDSLLQKQITSEDLTEEYVDTKARIRAKEKVRERYYEFLKKAGTVKDVLAVEADLRELDEEIESATGRANYINHQSALSEVHLVYFQLIPVKTDPIAVPGYASQVADNFVRGLEFMKEMMLALVAIWPLAIFILFLVWIFRRSGKSRRTAVPVGAK